MTRHLSDERVVDLAEGEGRDAERAHLDDCRVCAGRVADAEQMLAVARLAVVPEPTDAYWPVLAAGVNRRIDAEPRRSPAWRWLLPLAATAAGVVVALTHGPVPPANPVTPAPAVTVVAPWSALPSLEDDEALTVLEIAGGPVTAALDEGRGLGFFVAGLTDDETQELAEQLRGLREEGEL